MPRNPSTPRTRRTLAPATRMMGYGYDPALSEGALKCPVFLTSTFVFRTAEQGKDFFALAYGLRPPRDGEKQGLIYSRLNNPDLEILEDRLTLWDDAEAGAVFASGMAAISTTLLEFAQPGDFVLTSSPIYGGTDHLTEKVLPKFGIRPLKFLAGSSPAEIQALIDRSKARGKIAAVLVETPANPTNRLVDIAACAEIAKRNAPKGRIAPLIVDNTYLGPVFQQPLHHGADLVVYSATKFLGGHSDLIAGAVLGSRELVGRVKALRTFFGCMCGPWTGWLLMRSLETLKLRMTQSQENARQVADFLAAHPAVDRVHYLGHLREGDPQWGLYQRQCKGPGSMISFEVKGGEAEAFRVLNALRVIHLAVSLGGTESLASHPASMTHADIPADRQLQVGITPTLVRLSVGVEDAGDLIADLGQALSKASAKRGPAAAAKSKRGKRRAR
ncbi:MAG: cystathionine gamma-synthase family protein [Planctomycetes bacterium]|nr:cystathionine gamma-synthase family protein [Planctomycetota bacterium]